MNTNAFLKKKEEDVREDEMFFYRLIKKLYTHYFLSTSNSINGMCFLVRYFKSKSERDKKSKNKEKDEEEASDLGELY